MTACTSLQLFVDDFAEMSHWRIPNESTFAEYSQRLYYCRIDEFADEIKCLKEKDRFAAVIVSSDGTSLLTNIHLCQFCLPAWCQQSSSICVVNASKRKFTLRANKPLGRFERIPC